MSCYKHASPVISCAACGKVVAKRLRQTLSERLAAALAERDAAVERADAEERMNERQRGEIVSLTSERDILRSDYLRMRQERDEAQASVRVLVETISKISWRIGKVDRVMASRNSLHAALFDEWDGDQSIEALATDAAERITALARHDIEHVAALEKVVEAAKSFGTAPIAYMQRLSDAISDLSAVEARKP